MTFSELSPETVFLLVPDDGKKYIKTAAPNITGQAWNAIDYYADIYFNFPANQQIEVLNNSKRIPLKGL
jgi:hypothetical protein